MSTRIITPPSMDINRDMSQSCPDTTPPTSVVTIAGDKGESNASLPESAGGCVPITTSSLGCPSPAISPNSSSSMMMGPTTELILSTRIHKVPRCLFGPPDPLTAQFAREKVKEIREQDRNRYNFDFDREEPLEGPIKWEAVPVAPPCTTTSTTSSGSNYAPKAYALSRLPYCSGLMLQDRGVSRPPLRTTINNNQLPPTREYYFQPERNPLLIVRTVEEESRNRSSTNPSSSVTSIQSSLSLSSSPCATVTSSTSQHSRVSTVVDPTLLLPSPDASSCSSEDSANVLDMEMELEEEEDVITSLDSSSTEDDIKISTELPSQESDSKASKTSTSAISKTAKSSLNPASSSSSGLSSRACSRSSTSSCSSPTSSRRTKSVSSSSSSPSASPSSPSSSQTTITRYLPMRKRAASSTTSKAASESAPASSAANNEKKRAC